MNEDDKLLEEMYEDHDAISYSTETGKFIITMLEDIERMRELHRTNPIIRNFVEREINLKREYVHEIPRGNITGYEVTGFLWFHQGEEYTLDPEVYYNGR